MLFKNICKESFIKLLFTVYLKALFYNLFNMIILTPPKIFWKKKKANRKKKTKCLLSLIWNQNSHNNALESKLKDDNKLKFDFPLCSMHYNSLIINHKWNVNFHELKKFLEKHLLTLQEFQIEIRLIPVFSMSWRFVLRK